MTRTTFAATAAASAWLIGLFLLAPIARAADPLTLDVWPGKPPGEAGILGDEKWDGKKVTNVTKPALTVFRPEKDKDTGVAVIVCPGGGIRT